MVTSKRAPGYFVPVDESGNVGISLSGRKVTTTQAFNAISIGAGVTTQQTNFMDLTGYDQLGITVLNDAATNTVVFVYWSNDSITVHGVETVIASTTNRWPKGNTAIGARYAKVVIQNNDTVAHTYSAWAYPRS